MTRLLRFLTLIVAILALSAPSASLGMGVAVPAWTPSNTSVSVKAFSCKSMGGKRVLPCHPDLGVMAGPFSITVLPGNPPSAPSVALPLTAMTPEAELPPPRRV